MLDGLLEQSLRSIPGTGSSVQGGDLLLAHVLLQALLQHALEQRVKTIPLLARVEEDKEDVRALQPVQARPHVLERVIPPNGGGTQLGAERVQNRGSHEHL